MRLLVDAATHTTIFYCTRCSHIDTRASAMATTGSTAEQYATIMNSLIANCTRLEVVELLSQWLDRLTGLSRSSSL